MSAVATDEHLTGHEGQRRDSHSNDTLPGDASPAGTPVTVRDRRAQEDVHWERCS